MPEQHSSSNIPLTSMIVIGVAAVAIGLITTGAAEPDPNGFTPPEPGLTGWQIFGIGLAGFGGVLLAAAWAVAAVLQGLKH